MFMYMEGETCKPIDSLKELWNYFKKPPSWAKHVSPIKNRTSVIKNKDICMKEHACHYAKGHKALPQRHEYGSLSKTIVCHDMQNGYLDDRYVDGSKDHSAYSFYHWAAIDIFIYFSHHFITIPPLGWITVAHEHGVQILGTIITEWDDGFDICKQIFASEEVMMKFADHILMLAKHFKLDGWLINIENEVKETELLVKFVERLTYLMHRFNVNSKVIWYDSVINTGKLEWQNCLNEKNKIYFDACDGLFTNYSWNLSHLKSSAKIAGDRKHDVYVGVDVWGRNFWGGGGFNTADAVKEVFNCDLSMAIFAPAWTRENISTDDIHYSGIDECYKVKVKLNFDQSNVNCQLKDIFLLRETAFWNTLWPYLNSRGPAWLPFKTFFCLGSGQTVRYHGEVSSTYAWYNLCKQQHQPSYPVCCDNFALDLVPEPVIKKVNKESQDAPIPNTDLESNVIASNVLDLVLGPMNKENQAAPIPNADSKSNDIESNAIDLVPEPVNKESQAAPILNTDSESNEIEPNAEGLIEKTCAEVCEASRYKAPKKTFKVRREKEKTGCTSYYMDDSFFGGNCLKISPLKTDENDIRYKIMTRILMCEFQCYCNFVIFCIVKPLSDNKKANQDLNFHLTLKQRKGDEVRNYTLCEKRDEDAIDDNNKHRILLPLDKTRIKFIKENHGDFYVDPVNRNGWKVRYYMLEFPKSTMLQIDCELVNDSCPMLLGGLGIVSDIFFYC